MTQSGKKKIITARLWPRFEGYVSPREAIISGLDKGQFQTIIIYLMKNSDKPNLFEQKGFKVFYISDKKFFRVFNLPAILKLAKILRAEQVNILQCHGHIATVYGTIAGAIVKLPVILNHIPGLNRSRRLKRKILNFFIFKKLTKILTTGEAVKQDVLKSNFALPEEKVISIGNSIDFEKFADAQVNREKIRAELKIANDALAFITVGRLVPTKGHKHLIEAFAKVKKRIGNTELIITGQGRLQNELAELAKQLGCSESVHFTGSRTDVPQLLKAMDIFVLSSIAEGLPRSLLEAMAAGVVSIGTCVGGTAEIIRDGKTGLLAESANSDSLAKAMINLAEMSKENRSKIAQAAKENVKNNYSNRVVIKRLENLYIHEFICACGFSKYLKYYIELEKIGTESVRIADLAVQYNPERFKQYETVTDGTSRDALDMKNSPHCRMLKAYAADKEKFMADITANDYYKTQRLFGKNHKSALSKVRRFIELYESIKTNGFISEIIVTETPTVENEYNSGYEIYTGHHRVACCINLGIESVPALIMRKKA